MKVSPTLLSWVALPLGFAWIAAGVVHGIHLFGGSLEDMSLVWLALFAAIGPIAFVMGGTLLTIRLREKSRFLWIDRVALVVVCIGTILFITILAVSWFQIHQANQKLPPSLRVDARQTPVLGLGL